MIKEYLPADPAPAHINLISFNGILEILAAESIPANVTDPVPCISSLNIRYLYRYLSSNGTALDVSKS
jgi:hypothetical protein